MECYLYHMHMDLVLPPGGREVGGVWKEVGRGVWRKVGRGVWREVWEESVEGGREGSVEGR